MLLQPVIDHVQGKEFEQSRQAAGSLLQIQLIPGICSRQGRFQHSYLLTDTNKRYPIAGIRSNCRPEQKKVCQVHYAKTTNMMRGSPWKSYPGCPAINDFRCATLGCLLGHTLQEARIIIIEETDVVD